MYLHQFDGTFKDEWEEREYEKMLIDSGSLQMLYPKLCTRLNEIGKLDEGITIIANDNLETTRGLESRLIGYFTEKVKELFDLSQSSRTDVGKHKDEMIKETLERKVDEEQIRNYERYLNVDEDIIRDMADHSIGLGNIQGGILFYYNVMRLKRIVSRNKRNGKLGSDLYMNKCPHYNSAYERSSEKFEEALGILFNGL